MWGIFAVQLSSEKFPLVQNYHLNWDGLQCDVPRGLALPPGLGNLALRGTPLLSCPRLLHSLGLELLPEPQNLSLC